MEPMNENVKGVWEKLVACLTVTAKILCYILLMMGVAGVFAFLAGDLSTFFPIIEKNALLGNILMEICMLAGAFIPAFLLLRYWDRLPFSDLGLSLKGRTKDILWGAFVAFVIYAVGFSILCFLGEIEIANIHFDGSSLLLSWIFMLLVAITEETALRGFVLGRLLNAGVNRFVALFISAALFSLLHIFNFNFSFIAFLNILLAGMLLGSTYIYTRNLWFPITLHLFWNWFQGPILGFRVSGEQSADSLLSLNLPEENIINGGAFGFEGSSVCTTLMIIAILLILKSASKQSACDPYPRSVSEPGRADE